MRRDYFRLRRKQRGDVQQAVERSIRLREAREESLKRLDLNIPSSLPIAEHADEIVGLLQDHDVLILAGETGSGKTTQIPQFLFELDPEAKIVVCQVSEVVFCAADGNQKSS